MLRIARIGDYELGAQHDRGGMGAVYQARHVDSGELVAIKVADDDPQSARSLEHEVRGLRHLEHPGVVRALGSGVAQGRTWLALEWLQPGPFPVRDGMAPSTIGLDFDQPLPDGPRPESGLVMGVDRARALDPEPPARHKAHAVGVRRSAVV